MEVEFSELAYSQLTYWKKKDKKIYSRIEQPIDSIRLNAFEGIGKPEPNFIPISLLER